MNPTCMGRASGASLCARVCYLRHVHGTETGIAGVGLLAPFYLACMTCLWPLTRNSFAITAPRLPYYGALIGAAMLKVVRRLSLKRQITPR